MDDFEMQAISINGVSLSLDVKVDDQGLMDQEISDKIDELMDSITGGNQKTVSFVSDKNTDVKAVQFVIQTEKIEKPEQEEAQPEETQNMNFWQKLVNLFKK